MEVLSQGTLGNDNIYDAMYEVGLENGEDALWSEEWDEDEAENEVMFESWSSQEAYMQGYRDARD